MRQHLRDCPISWLAAVQSLGQHRAVVKYVDTVAGITVYRGKYLPDAGANNGLTS